MFARAQEAGAKTGPLNLITDVVGVRVGNATLNTTLIVHRLR
jgi:L-aminopeptidase/D-esterase-like protein